MSGAKETQSHNYDVARGNKVVRVTGEETILSSTSAQLANPGGLTNILHALACPMSGTGAETATLRVSHNATTISIRAGNSTTSIVYKWEAEGYIV